MPSLCRQFVLLAGAAAVVEFCVSMVLFSSHHQLSAVDAHVRQVMRRPLPSLDQVRRMTTSQQEQQAFYRAMDWLDEMGQMDTRRVKTHVFSWSEQWRDLSDAIRRKTVRVLIGNEWRATPSPPSDQELAEFGLAIDREKFEPLCARGQSSVRRRRRGIASVADKLLQLGETGRGHLNTAFNEIAADLSSDNSWHALTAKFDVIWNLQNISLSQRAYEIGVNQQCLYTVKIRILQELKEVRNMFYV